MWTTSFTCWRHFQAKGEAHLWSQGGQGGRSYIWWLQVHNEIGCFHSICDQVFGRVFPCPGFLHQKKKKKIFRNSTDWIHHNLSPKIFQKQAKQPLFVSSNRSFYSDDCLLYIYLLQQQIFQIFTQSIDVIHVTSVTQSCLNSINAIDVTRC